VNPWLFPICKNSDKALGSRLYNALVNVESQANYLGFRKITPGAGDGDTLRFMRKPPQMWPDRLLGGAASPGLPAIIRRASGHLF
jgi:hypothetical protein